MVLYCLLKKSVWICYTFFSSVLWFLSKKTYSLAEVMWAAMWCIVALPEDAADLTAPQCISSTGHLTYADK